MPRILLVDDDPQSLESTRRILELSGHEVITAENGEAALNIIRPSVESAKSRFDAVITDVRMPKLGGLEFLRAMSLCDESTPVILMTAFGRVEDAVWAMKLGAVDFLMKPFRRQALLQALDAALKRCKSREETVSGNLIGSSEPMARIRAMIAQVAPTAASVLLSGESGTGKELVARSIHERSARAKEPFVALNCAAVPEQLIESEVFGFEKGAFTGAVQAKAGLFETAHGGTVLLDEIGDMPLPLQAKLLRFLQEGEVRRLGSNASKKVDVRIIAASHRDLHELAREGRFRQDLLFRLDVIKIEIPALRERGAADIRELAYRFLQQACRRHGKAIDAIDPEAMATLEAHPWPGNVRELANVLERAVVFARSETIVSEDFPPHLASQTGERDPASISGRISVPIGTPLREVEELLIRRTLEATDGDKNMTAKLLGINSRTIYRKLDKKDEAQEPGEQG